MASDDLILDSAFLRKLEYLHIVSKRVAGQFKAERQARERGAGLEFADHRAYTPGDDFRHVDWKAYQRLDKLLLRLFEEEQDLPVYLLIDCSRSMTVGGPSKLHYARQIAAALCYVGLAHLDRVTIAGYSHRVTHELRSQRGKGQIFTVLRFLVGLAPDGETDARQAFKAFCAHRRTRGLAVVISDFLDPGGFQGGLDVLRFFRHDVFAVHVTTPTDAEPDLRGDLALVDSETGAARQVTVTRPLLRAYEEAFQRFCQEMAAYCWKYRFGYVRTVTAVPFEDAILQVFRQGRFLA